MASTDNSVVAIGWDVAGWRSPGQAVAIALVCDGAMSWPGLARGFRFDAGEPVGLHALTKHAWNRSVEECLGAADRVVVAIDSPLAFPNAFRKLLDGEFLLRPPAAQIDNPLAFRSCDRWVAEHYGKPPLPASFDKLGNPATLAMTACGELRRDGFRVVPQDARRANRAVIEVYPALNKRGKRNRADPAIDPVHRLIPDGVVPGTDAYDAAICALLGLAFAGMSGSLGLVDLPNPDRSLPREEGWIFGLPTEFIEKHRFL